MNKKKIAIITCGTTIGLIILALIGLFIFGILAAFLIPFVTPPRPDDKYISKQLSNKLYRSFEISCENYKHTEGKAPDKFSQFVSLKEKDAVNEKLDMEYMTKNFLLKPDSDDSLNSNSLEVEFKTGYKVTYTLGSECNISMTTGKP